MDLTHYATAFIFAPDLGDCHINLTGEVIRSKGNEDSFAASLELSHERIENRAPP